MTDVIKTYNLYYLADPITKEIRYIGITVKSLSSRLSNHIRHARAGEKNYRANWVRKILSQGLKPIIELIEETTDFNRESALIAEYRAKGFRLVNTTSGGEGCHNLSKEARERISQSLRQRVISDHTRKLLAEATRNRVVTAETKKKISAYCTGRKKSPHKLTTIAKIKQANLGHQVSKITRDKISATLTGRPTGRKKSHCKNGHEYTAENTYQITLTRRDCKKCIALRGKKAYAIKKSKEQDF